MPAAESVYLDSDGDQIGSAHGAHTPIGSSWSLANGTFTPPADTTHVFIQLYFSYMSGWVAYDDASITATGSSTNIVPDPGFENGEWQKGFGNENLWVLNVAGGTSAPRTGSKSFGLSNFPYGYITSDPMPVTAGQSYDFSFYARGEIDSNISLDSNASGRIVYLNSSGNKIGSTHGAHTPIGSNWSPANGTFTPPSGTTHVFIQLYFSYMSGWVAYDDASITATGSSTNIVPDPGFENGEWQKGYGNENLWLLNVAGGTSAPRTGSKSFGLSNLPYGYIKSENIAVVAEHEYDLSFYARGAVDPNTSLDSNASGRIAYLDSDGNKIGSDHGAHIAISSNWSLASGSFTPPVGTTHIYVELYFSYMSGWVAFDDLSIDPQESSGPVTTGIPLPEVSLSSNVSVVGINENYTLTWSTAYATSCTASGDWSGSPSMGANLTQTMSQATVGQKTYTLTCTNGTGTTVETVAVEILPAPVTMNIDATSPRVTLDNGGNGTSSAGSWSTSTYDAGYYGNHYAHDGNSDKGLKSFKYQPTLHSGQYTLYMRWTASSNRATNVPIDIHHANGASTVRVNQQINNGGWVALGTYSFNAGNTGYARIRTHGTNGYVVADAMLFVPVVTSPTADITLTGEWTTSTYDSGYYGSAYIHDENSGAKNVRFTPNVPLNGTYRVEARWTSGTTRATNARFDIHHAGGTSTVTQNQQQNGGQWRDLGTYSFNAGTSHSIQLLNTGANGYVIADAIRLVPVSLASSGEAPLVADGVGELRSAVRARGPRQALPENSLIRKTYLFAGQPIAQVSIEKADGVILSSELHYIYTDHLGSASTIIDDSGALIDTQRFLPFGEYRTAPTTDITERGFTGHHENRDIGLTYMNARFYVPYLNHFASADTIVPDPTNPQAYNRYSYVYNNPLRFNDPSGHDPETVPGPACGIFCRLGRRIGRWIDDNTEPILPEVSIHTGSKENSPAPDWVGDARDSVGNVLCGFAFGACYFDGDREIVRTSSNSELIEDAIFTAGMSGLGGIGTVLDDVGGATVRSSVLRRSAGTAISGGNLRNVTGQWLRGSNGVAGRIPGQIAEALNGRTFNSFDEFRSELWRSVANDPALANQFSTSNQRLMANGNAPIAPTSQQINGQRTYQLHHTQPINQGGGVYDIDNLVVVTPRYHQEVLAPGYHYGR